MLQKDFFILYIAIGLMILNIYLIYKKNSVIEGMYGAVNTEALANLASMYKNGVLKVSSLEVTGPATIKGKLNCASDVDVSGDINGDNIISDNDLKAKTINVSGDGIITGIRFTNFSNYAYIQTNQSNGFKFAKFQSTTPTSVTSHNVNASGNLNGSTVNGKKPIYENDNITIKNKYDELVQIAPGVKKVGSSEELIINKR
jgi:hypothetical protein